MGPTACSPPHVSPCFGLQWQQGQGQRIPQSLPSVQGVACGRGIQCPLPPPGSLGTRLLLPLSPGSRGSQLGALGVLEPRGCSVSPPSWGHWGQSDHVREGPGDTFSLSLAPRCHHRHPKIAGSSCSASSRWHCLRAGPPRLTSPGGDRHRAPRDGCPPAPAGTPRRTRLPREREMIFSLFKSPGSQSPHSHPPPWPGRGRRRQGLSPVPSPFWVSASQICTALVPTGAPSLPPRQGDREMWLLTCTAAHAQGHPSTGAPTHVDTHADRHPPRKWVPMHMSTHAHEHVCTRLPMHVDTHAQEHPRTGAPTCMDTHIHTDTHPQQHPPAEILPPQIP